MDICVIIKRLLLLQELYTTPWHLYELQNDEKLLI